MIDTYTPSFAVPLVGYMSRKAAQACAYFAGKDAHGLDKLKLIKLVYLAERKFLEDFHMPMVWDELYSLKNGPVCSSTLNGIDGRIDQRIWHQYISRNGNKTLAVRKFERDDFDELSNAEIKTLEAIWARFGSWTASGLRNYTHTHCAEYVEVSGGRLPISYRSVLEALGEEEAEAIEQEIDSFRKAQVALAS